VATAIETSGLSRRFGDVRAVDGLDLRVERGEVYAFIGRNGAGKTTTIGMLLGMIRPTAGSIRLLGAEVARGRGPWRRVGYLVDRAAAYPELTVRENLDVARRLCGVDDPSSTDRVIALLGLDDYATRRAGGLSHGNLQRLALARALVHGPELIVLDEPATGLDPAGIVEIRRLLAGLARDSGVTVFLSSHALAEVDRMATRIGIIHRGRLVQELDPAGLDRLRARRLAVDAPDREAALRVLRAAGHDVVVAADGSLALEDERAIAAPEAVALALAEAGVYPSRLAVEQDDLEAHFLAITGEAS
jgi:ABC-2 type transport system ATP-binding protein